MIIYKFDGTLKGLYSCIFHSFVKNEIPNVITNQPVQESILIDKVYNIITCDEEATRVYAAIQKYAKDGGVADIEYAFRSGQSDKYQIIFEYIRKILEYRKDISGNFKETAVCDFYELIRKIGSEVHRMKGFMRFSETQEKIYYAHFEPDNDISDLLLPHFSQRFKNIPFALHDTKRNILAMSFNGERRIIKLNCALNVWISQKEEKLQSLFRLYYEKITVNERIALIKKRTHIPQKYMFSLFEKSSKNKDCLSDF